MATNRRMTPEVLAQQPGVVAVFLSGAGDFGRDVGEWRQTAGRMFVTANDRQWQSVIMHINDKRTLHLLRGEERAIIIVIETGCKFSKCVARSMRRALDSVKEKATC